MSQHVITMRILLGALCLLAWAPALCQTSRPSPAGREMVTAQTTGARGGGDALRKAAQNPVSSMISVPLQENWNFNIGPYDRIQNVMNIQPVVPFSLGPNTNLIVRWITPAIFQPDPSSQNAGYHGLGDMNPSFFFAPKSGKLIWGAGPTMILPTATKTTYLGQGKWSMGPTAVALVQPGKWTVGGLVSNVWSYAGHKDRDDVNQMVLQYFLNYNLNKGYYLTWQPTLTANWNADDKHKWVVPYGGGIGRIMAIGMQPANVGVQFYGNAVHPDGTSPWTMRVSVTFLYPKRPKPQP